MYRWLLTGCLPLLACQQPASDSTAPAPQDIGLEDAVATAVAPQAGGAAGATTQAPPNFMSAAGAAASFNVAGFDGPPKLSQTGLYADIATRALAQDVAPYTPLAQLWSDNLEKARWVRLPPDSRIDTADMDAWRYPVGTKLWKEFALGDVPLETRLLEKLEDGSWRMVAYAWDADHADATAAPLGVKSVAGTEHDIPDTDKCKQCHEGLPDRVLGFSALQLSHPGDGVTMERLVSEDKLSVVPAQPLQLPGDRIAQRALGYLHANCGHCHRPDRKRAAREISVYFWQKADALASVTETVTFSSLVTHKRSPLWIDAVVARMQTRGGIQQMPPLATKQVDEAGVEAVATWLEVVRQSFEPVDSLAPVESTARCDGVEEVFAIFERAACRSAFCHGAGTGELDFTNPEQLHASMVGVPASGEGCRELTTWPRVQPGDPDHSLLMIKLLPGPPCGKIMPPAEIQALSEHDLDVVRNWIASCTPAH